MTDSEYRSCVTQSRSWDQRATLDDASWGGSHRTIVTERFGVPLEVTIALSNLLQAHPWLNIPHNADDNYVEEYAKQLANELDDSLQAHIEYSNEIWNSGFWAHNYASYMVLVVSEEQADEVINSFKLQQITSWKIGRIASAETETPYVEYV